MGLCWGVCKRRGTLKYMDDSLIYPQCSFENISLVLKLPPPPTSNPCLSI